MHVQGYSDISMVVYYMTNRYMSRQYASMKAVVTKLDVMERTITSCTWFRMGLCTS